MKDITFFLIQSLQNQVFFYTYTWDLLHSMWSTASWGPLLLYWTARFQMIASNGRKAGV